MIASILDVRARLTDKQAFRLKIQSDISDTVSANLMVASVETEERQILMDG